MARGTERLADLVRMLNLLPYFEAHPDRSVMEAARDLGREPQDIMDDLNRLWCCGLPGLMPGDLVDLQHDYRRVRVDNAQGMNRPLRLTTTEAAALLLALENLETTPGLVDKTAVISAANKLREIMGPQVAFVADATPETPESPELVLIRTAMELKVQLSFEYFSQTTYTSSTRVVSAAHVFTSDGHTYLRAWDHDVKKHRTFRIDRMSNLILLEDAATPRASSLSFSTKDPFRFGKATAQLAVTEDYAWISDYVPLTLDGPAEAGWHPAHMPVGSEEWLIRFVLAAQGKVRVLAPTRLAEAVAQRAARALQAYDEPTD